MDAINDYYMEELNLSAMKRFFWEQGERRILEKQDYFVRQGERSGRVAVCYLLGAGDGAAVLAGLGSVVLYYGILWLLRRKIDNAIHFTISE